MANTFDYDELNDIDLDNMVIKNIKKKFFLGE